MHYLHVHVQLHAVCCSQSQSLALAVDEVLSRNWIMFIIIIGLHSFPHYYSCYQPHHQRFSTFTLCSSNLQYVYMILQPTYVPGWVNNGWSISSVLLLDQKEVSSCDLTVFPLYNTRYKMTRSIIIKCYSAVQCSYIHACIVCLAWTVVRKQVCRDRTIQSACHTGFWSRGGNNNNAK